MKKIFQDLEYAKKVLADPAQYDKGILEVAMDAGFYEIKKFNVEFRKDTNMCPVEYRAFHTQFRLVTGMSPEEYQQQKKSA
ncbi:MAG: helix-turn-helix transcriptional regulator [Balneolaceae bacterium]|nr:helix-turn-helix transcriptional regulator [Balneolaceae bacterium]